VIIHEIVEVITCIHHTLWRDCQRVFTFDVCGVEISYEHETVRGCELEKGVGTMSKKKHGSLRWLCVPVADLLTSHL
jgi:hypothetical protein